VEDQNLAERLAARDTSALEALMELHMRDVYRVVARVLAPASPEDIEEVASQAFIAAWRTAPHYDPARAPLRTWLLMHAKYAALEHRRREARWARGAPSASSRPEDDPFEQIAAREERERVQDALSRLPALDREIVYRRYFLEEDIAVLAQDVGLTRGAVDKRLWRARGALREMLAATADGEGGNADEPR
jgi:RNA polymerase sigma-70 factor (ECF subfamily)